MTITIEEMRKVDIAFEYVSDSAILKLARFVAERQRAVEPTDEMESEASVVDRNAGYREIFRAMSAVAPLVVEG